MSDDPAPASESRPAPRVWVQFLVVLALVVLLFGLVEVLPLHFGPRHLAWDSVVGEVRRRGPRMVLVGLAVAGFLVLGRQRTGTR